MTVIRLYEIFDVLNNILFNFRFFSFAFLCQLHVFPILESVKVSNILRLFHSFVNLSICCELNKSLQSCVIFTVDCFILEYVHRYVK